MPTCPSCSSITFTASATNTNCISAWEAEIFCTANPFDSVETVLQYSATSTGPWTAITESYLNSYNIYGPAYNHVENFPGATGYWNGTLNDFTGKLLFKHECNEMSLFQKNKTGYYRVEATITYTASSTVCVQTSNSVLITIGTGNKIDLEANVACGCIITDATYGTSSKLALNFQSSTPTCPATCVFEQCPTLLSMSDGDIVYNLPTNISDRSVILFNINDIGPSNSPAFTSGVDSMYWTSETAGYITEVAFLWPDAYEFTTGGTSVQTTTFKVGVFNKDHVNQIYSWGTHLTGVPNSTHQLLAAHRNRHINFNGSNLTANYQLHTTGTHANSIHLLSPTNTNNLLDGKEYKNYFDNTQPIQWSYYGLVVACDYNDSDSAGDLVGNVLVNLNPEFMADPLEVKSTEMAPMFMYPEYNYYDASNANPGVLPIMNAEIGVTSGFDYKTYCSGDLQDMVTDNHVNIYSLDESSNTLVTGTSNHPCSGAGSNCPPYYHSSDANAPHTTTGRLKILNRIEYVSATPGDDAEFPSTLTAVKLRYANGSLTGPVGGLAGEGWYHIVAKEWNNEVYNAWSSSNPDTPAMNNGSAQHWASLGNAGLSISLHQGYTELQYRSSLFLQFEIYFENGTDTWRYGFNPLGLNIAYGVTPYQIDEAGKSTFKVLDVTTPQCSNAYFGCDDPIALNYNPGTTPTIPTNGGGVGISDGLLFPLARAVKVKRGITCLYCDYVSGFIEIAPPGDDGTPGDIAEAFKFVSINTTNPTFANWGDGAVTLTVNRTALFADNFPFPVVNYRYKAVLYKVITPGASWTDPSSFIVNGGIQDMLTTPVVTFSSTTYPSPLLLPEGHYSIKWSINVIDPGVYQIEECWWEYPVTLTATNAAPNPPIFINLGIHTKGFSFVVQAFDTKRSIVDSPTLTPIFDSPTSSFTECQTGRCLDSGSLTGIVGTNITMIGGGSVYGYKDVCIAAGHTWNGFDHISAIEDVTATNYGNMPSKPSYSQPNPLSGAPYPNYGYAKTLWESGYYYPSTSPNFFNSSMGTLYPSSDIDVKVTWESGFTKTFTLTTPIMHGRQGAIGLLGWWDDGTVSPCNNELYPVSNPEYNETGLYFSPLVQTAASNNYSYIGSAQHHVVTMSTTTLHHFNQIFVNQKYYKVLEMPTQAPTYPLEFYQGVADSYLTAGGTWKGIFGSFSTTAYINYCMGIDLATNGTATFHTGHILGGFTGEIQYKVGHVSVLKSWFDSNSLPSASGTLYTAGNSTVYDGLITSLQNTTGAANQGNITNPAVIGGIGTAGTLTDADSSGIFFEEGIFYAKDCPVCLTPQFDKACRMAGSINLDTSNMTGAPIASQDDGSCLKCEAGTGKLQVDSWDQTDNDPAHFAFYDTNPSPYPSSGVNLNVSNLVEGTGNILDLATGANSWGAADALLNVVDGSNFLGKTWYKMQSLNGGYLDYATDTTDNKGAIVFQANFWTQFLLGSSVSMGNLGTNFQVHYELFYYNINVWVSIETRTTSHYNNGSPGSLDVFDATTNTLGGHMEYGHYKLRVRAVDTNVGLSGPLSTCFQDVYFNMRVLVCSSIFQTVDGIVISDVNERFVDPAHTCNCCPAPVLTAATSGSGCSITRSINVSYNCTSSNATTTITQDLNAMYLTGPLAGIPQSLGSPGTITGNPITTSTTLAHQQTGLYAVYGVTYFITSTYTGGPCDGTVLTSAPLVVQPIPSCDCQDPTATNYLTIIPGGNADCVGAIGGLNYSCCTYPTSCSAPSVAIVSSACSVALTVSSTCSGTLPDTTQMYIMDVSASSNVWDPTNPVYTGATVLFSPTTNTISWAMTESCSLNEISVWAGLSNGVFVVLQTQTWTTTGYTIDSVSPVFTLGTGSNPLGTGHFPVICGCTVQTVGSPAITATNYDATATCSTNTCIYPGCTDPTSTNYNAAATVDDGSCLSNPGCGLGNGFLFGRPNCAGGWCDPEIVFSWSDCNLDPNGNIIESPTTVSIKTIFSVDDGATWVSSTAFTIAVNLMAPGNSSNTSTYFGTNLFLQDMFTAWFNEGLISSPDIFDCAFTYAVVSTYASSPTSTSVYAPIVRILNPTGPNTFGWPLNALDVPNFTPGQQTNCHPGTFHQTLWGMWPHSAAGQPVVILVAPCGCTDSGNITPSTGWFAPTVTPYTSPINGVGAYNIMTNPSMGVDDGSCVYAGCMDSSAGNYNIAYTQDCTSICGTTDCCCTFSGCTDSCAINYDPSATADDGSCVLPNPTVTGAWTAATGCNKTYRITYQEAAHVGAAWGFTSVANYGIVFDPGGANITVGPGGTIAVSPSNYEQIVLSNNNCVGNGGSWTQGAGLYRVTATLIYPGGSPACDITLVYDINITLSDFVVCDCMNCSSCGNYNPLTTCDDGSCTGCTDITASNYNPGAVIDDGSCIIEGCTDPGAANYNILATVDNGSCLYWHSWEECTSGARTSFGGGAGGTVTLLDNQVGLNLINPLETIGEIFQFPYWDGSLWVTGCWKYIGSSSSSETYTNPTNGGVGPSQWQSTTVTTTYANCLACIPVPGCMDPIANNYNVNCAGTAVVATVDDFCCDYPCCDFPLLLQASGHVDSCDAEYVMTVDCNNPSTDNADTITTTLQFWDGSAWQVANTDVHNPTGTDNIVNHSVTYHYNCSADDFGGYGTGQYRVFTEITYSNGYTCDNHSSGSIVITLDPKGCTNPNATNYDSTAICQCVTCLFNHCCSTPVLTLDSTNGICNQSLECEVQCDPDADDGYTALWQSFATGSWVTIDTQTSAGPTGSTTLTLANSYLHTASGTSENYRVVFTSDYTAPTPDCTVYSNILTVVAPILGCMDGGLTEYTVGVGGIGFGTAADGITASNYNSLAECDDLSCCVDGCTDALATNYDPLATCNLGCTYGCCTSANPIANYSNPCIPQMEWTSDFSACPATVTSMKIEWLFNNGTINAIMLTTVYPTPVNGTTYVLPTAISTPLLTGVWHVFVTYTYGGTSIPDCTTNNAELLIEPILGCTNPLSINYDPLATCDDGSCITPVYGCTDALAVNYNPNASNDDGSCIYCGSGCTDTAPGYTNYDASAICDCDNVWINMGTCSDTAYYDSAACSAGGGTWTNTYVNNTISSTWNTCCISCVYGCTDNSWTNHDPLATCPCNSSDPTQGNTGPLDPLLDNDCCTSCIYGCTDNGSFNQAWWDGTNSASFDYATNTGISVYGVSPNPTGASNYNSLATCEDGSCTYAGCIDPLADNYNSNLVADCIAVVGGTNYSCCIYPTSGCTDIATPAFNITPLATLDDGSCMYCDLATGNYEDSAGTDQATWATGTYTQVPTTDVATADGQLFASFNLTAVGIALQNTAEFLTGTNSFAIEIYSVSAYCGASSGGTLISTGPLTPSSNTLITHNFTGLAYGYYTMKLVVINSAGLAEPTNCWVEECALVQATVCDDPLAANQSTIAADLRFADASLCIYPGFCACSASLSVTTGTPCSNLAVINATVSCTVFTDISWSWQDAGGNTLLSGVTSAVLAGQIIASLPVSSNATYTFIWDETSTPYATCPQQTISTSVTSIISCDCTDPLAANYNGSASYNCLGIAVPNQSAGWNASPCCLSCIYGCMSSTALNYNPTATCDDGSCIEPGDGCCDPGASNYNSAATNCLPVLCEYCN